MKKICFLLPALLAASSLFAQGGFLARPTKLYFNPAPLSQQKQNITIRNTSNDAVILECTLQDWKRDSIGNKVYSTPGTFPNSCSKFLTVAPEAIALQPGEEKEVEIVLTAPNDSLKQALNAMLMLTQVNEKKAEKSKIVQTQIVVRMQIGVHVYFEPTYLEQKDVDLQRLFFAKTGTAAKEDLLAKERGLISEIVNIGQLVAEGKLRMELNNVQTQQVWKLNEKEFNSMPGDQLQIPFTLPANLPKGSYNILAMLDLGANLPLKVIEAQIDL